MKRLARISGVCDVISRSFAIGTEYRTQSIFYSILRMRDNGFNRRSGRFFLYFSYVSSFVTLKFVQEIYRFPFRNPEPKIERFEVQMKEKYESPDRRSAIESVDSFPLCNLCLCFNVKRHLVTEEVLSEEYLN